VAGYSAARQRMRISRLALTSKLSATDEIFSSFSDCGSHSKCLIRRRRLIYRSRRQMHHLPRYTMLSLQPTPTRFGADSLPSSHISANSVSCAACSYIVSCHEAISRTNPANYRCYRLSVLVPSCIMVIAFQTQTLLYMHTGDMAVNSPITLIRQLRPLLLARR
jgi:hypothetical protein